MEFGHTVAELGTNKLTVVYTIESAYKNNGQENRPLKKIKVGCLDKTAEV